MLSTIPFGKVNIRVLLVEMDHSNKEQIIGLMLRNGYRIHANLTHDTIYVKDGEFQD